jgi:hypothetical protein
MSRKKTLLLKATATGVQIGDDAATLSSSFTIDPDDNRDFYVLTTDGAVTLTNTITITNNSKIAAVAGDYIEIKYSGNIAISSYQVSFFGNNMPSNLTAVDCIVQAYYDGTNWNTVFIPSVLASVETVSNTNIVANSITAAELAAASVEATELATNAVTTAKITDSNVTTAKLATDAVTTVKITDANVTVEKLEAEALHSTFAVPIHFDYANKDNFYVSIPYKCTVDGLQSTVSGVAIGATHAATMTINNETAGAALLSTGTLHAATAAEGVTATISLSNTSLAQGAVLRFTPDGSQTTGKVFITLRLKKVAN